MPSHLYFVTLNFHSRKFQAPGINRGGVFYQGLFQIKEKIMTTFKIPFQNKVGFTFSILMILILLL